MIHHPILVNGEWREASFPVSSFRAINPVTAKTLPDSFPVSSFLDLDEMLQAEENSRTEIEAITFEQRSEFLTTLAAKLRQNAEELSQTANAETGLPVKPFLLEQEMSLMQQQLLDAARFCLDRSWRGITIDSRNNIRSMRVSLNGPVVIFGPACNPFSLNSCGGSDFACAIAAGNSVIAKSNPVYPLTSLKLARLIHEAATEKAFPGAFFQFFFHTTADLGYRLASHPMLGALAFTGSRKAGMSLKESADHSGNQAFISMTGMNPVVVLPGAVAGQKTEIARKLTDAVLQNEGQTCTRPGLVFIVENKESSSLIRSIVDEFNATSCRPLLSDLVAHSADTQVSAFIRLGARKLTRKEFYQPNPFVYPYTALHLDLKTWLKQSAQFQEEVFGPVIMFITLENDSQFSEALKPLDACSNLSVFAGTSESDGNILKTVGPLLRRKSARLLFDRLPTQRATSQAVVAGGGFPASNHPECTFSGMPAAITRFTRIQCHDGFTQTHLPDDLRSDNTAPGVLKLVDGKYISQ
mgnify:FL=1